MFTVLCLGSSMANGQGHSLVMKSSQVRLLVLAWDISDHFPLIKAFMYPPQFVSCKKILLAVREQKKSYILVCLLPRMVENKRRKHKWCYHFLFRQAQMNGQEFSWPWRYDWVWRDKTTLCGHYVPLANLSLVFSFDPKKIGCVQCLSSHDCENSFSLLLPKAYLFWKPHAF